MAKPVIFVKYALLYVNQGIIDKVTSWPQLIWLHLPAASDWPRTFLHPGCFCLA